MFEAKVYKYLPKEAKYIRKAVFMEEQGFENEFDDIDEKSCHVVIFTGEKKAAATGRLYKKTSDVYIIGRVAVLKEFRKFGLGSKVLSSLEETAKNLGAKYIELNSQQRVMLFYETNGYVSTGIESLDEGCKHMLMEKKL